MAQRVVVVGGGISGLAAAFHLRELAAARETPLEVIVLEAGSRAGGALHTIVREGFVAEAGADAFISDKTDALDLAGRLGLETEIVGTLEAHRRAFVVHRGKLVEVPRGFSLLAPSAVFPIIESELFSIPGKLRMLAEPMIRARTDAGDESLAAFVRRRFGAEALDRLVQPLAGGIYVADPETLSMQACFARFVAMERERGSLTRGLRRLRKNPAGGSSGVRWNLFLSFRDGMAMLVHALERSLGESISFGAEVAQIARRGAGWPLHSLTQIVFLHCLSSRYEKHNYLTLERRNGKLPRGSQVCEFPRRAKRITQHRSMATPPLASTHRRQSVLLRVVGLVFVLVIALVLGVAGWFYLEARTSLPQVDGYISVAGLTAPVSVIRDAQGVPHIRAASLHDLLFAQGYVAAQDRLWQIDSLRRAAFGELAEIVGPSALEHDRHQRLLLYRATAERAGQALPAPTRDQFDAYAQGVNAFVSTHGTIFLSNSAFCITRRASGRQRTALRWASSCTRCLPTVNIVARWREKSFWLSWVRN